MNARVDEGYQGVEELTLWKSSGHKSARYGSVYRLKRVRKVVMVVVFCYPRGVVRGEELVRE